MTDIYYASAPDPDEPPVLASFPVGSPEDTALRRALQRISEASNDPELDGEIAKTLDGRLSARQLLGSPQFADVLAQTGRRIRSSLEHLTPEQREDLAKRTAKFTAPE